MAVADRLYWLNNGPKAAPLYAKAEKLFADRGDARNELYAKIGRLRSEAETMSFVDLSRFLNDQLQNPIMRNDPRLRLWCLAAKGYTDIEIDNRAEKQDWLEAQQIAKSLGDDRWATRAAGELGVIAFLEGSSGRAAKLLGGALVSTMANGDKGGQIRFLEFLGIGMVEVNRPTEALMFFERAIKIAESEKDSGLPFMGYEGKAQALVATGRPDEAKAVLQDALAKARSQQKRGHEAQLLIVLGKLAEQNGNKQEAIAEAVWDLGLVTACPIHRCLLLDECPACKRKLAWQRPAVHKCRCGLDFRNLAPVAADSDLVAINWAIYRAAGFPASEVADLNLTNYGFPREMLEMRLGPLLRLILFVGCRLERGIGCARNNGLLLRPSLLPRPRSAMPQSRC